MVGAAGVRTLVKVVISLLGPLVGHCVHPRMTLRCPSFPDFGRRGAPLNLVPPDRSVHAGEGLVVGHQ